MDLKVETQGKYTRGMTVPEKRPRKSDPNTQVYTEIKSEKFLKKFKETLKSPDYNQKQEADKK